MLSYVVSSSSSTQNVVGSRYLTDLLLSVNTMFGLSCKDPILYTRSTGIGSHHAHWFGLQLEQLIYLRIFCLLCSSLLHYCQLLYSRHTPPHSQPFAPEFRCKMHIYMHALTYICICNTLLATCCLKSFSTCIRSV